MSKWDERFIYLAKHISTWSKDPSTKVGAVIVRPDNTIASCGYNGFPKGCDDTSEIYANREEKYGRVIHAEMNAILHAQELLKGYTIYMYSPISGPPCDRCAAHIIQAGITRVVHTDFAGGDSVAASRWKDSLDRSMNLFAEADVKVVPFD